jgi:Na+/proline symporter
VVAIYLIATIIIGLRFSKGQENVEDYFVARRSARWWAVGISSVATSLSAISYLGVPAWVFRYDLQLNAVVVLLPLFMLVVLYLFVPLLVRLRLTTIYEYLEVRFNLDVRTIASA